MQLNRVLVGIDFSAPSLAAARWAAECFAPRAELVLIHVIPEPRTPPYLARLRPGTPPDLAAAERSSALLGGLMALAASVGGPRATADVRIGEPAARARARIPVSGGSLAPPQTDSCAARACRCS
jgi:nucleotide-binding universal stress UspA family protein